MVNIIIAVFTALSAIAAAVSAIVASVGLYRSTKTQMEMKDDAKKQATIEAFNLIQKDVLDNLVDVEIKNARIIVENIEQEDCKISYNAYRVMIARLEHFSVGVNEGVYDIEIVDKLAGVHLIYLRKKVEAIIEQANRRSSKNIYYTNYLQLVEDLKNKHPEIKEQSYENY